MRLTPPLTRLAREDDGFSLIELLTAMVIGTLVLGAMSLVFIRTTAATTDAQNRIETSQTGRLAIDHMTSLLDSQTCLLSKDAEFNPISTPAIVAGDKDSVTFYADQNPSDSSVSPDKYKFTYDPATRRITETRWDAVGTEPSLKFDTAPSSVRTLVSDITYARDDSDAQQPVFKYYTFPTSGTAPTPVVAPLTASTLKTVTQIAIQFQPVARLKGTEDARRSSSISGQSYLHTADPDNKTVCP
jgi:prepilin-type N-terminal cleavage/methylation domain-containing protein